MTKIGRRPCIGEKPMSSSERGQRSRKAALERLRTALAKVDALVPLAWAINDALRIDGDTVTFEGSQNDVEEFMAWMKAQTN